MKEPYLENFLQCIFDVLNEQGPEFKGEFERHLRETSICENRAMNHRR